VITLPVTTDILSVRAVKTSCLSLAPVPPECWSHHSLFVSLQAGPHGELAWRIRQHLRDLVRFVSSDSTRCQDSESVANSKIRRAVPP